MDGKDQLRKKFNELELNVDDINKKIRRFPNQVIDYLDGFCNESVTGNLEEVTKQNYKKQ